MTQLVTGKCYICKQDVVYIYGKDRPGSLIACGEHADIVGKYNDVQGEILWLRFAGKTIEIGHPLFDEAKKLSDDMESMKK